MSGYYTLPIKRKTPTSKKVILVLILIVAVILGIRSWLKYIVNDDILNQFDDKKIGIQIDFEPINDPNFVIKNPSKANIDIKPIEIIAKDKVSKTKLNKSKVILKESTTITDNSYDKKQLQGNPNKKIIKSNKYIAIKNKQTKQNYNTIIVDPIKKTKPIKPTKLTKINVEKPTLSKKEEIRFHNTQIRNLIAGEETKLKKKDEYY